MFEIQHSELELFGTTVDNNINLIDMINLVRVNLKKIKKERK